MVNCLFHADKYNATVLHDVKDKLVIITYAN